MSTSPREQEHPVDRSDGNQDSDAPETSATRSRSSGGPHQRGVGQGKGGGPKTPEGKAKAARNATKFGVYSPNPTAGGESADDYQEFLAGVQHHHQPKTLYEEEIVSRITEDLWRLRRIIRQESDLINRRYEQIDPPRQVSFVKPSRYLTSWSAYKTPVEAWADLMLLVGKPDEYEFPADVVEDIHRALRDVSFVKFEATDIRFHPEHTAGALRRAVSRVAEINGWSEEKVLSDVTFLLECVQDLAHCAEERVRQIRDEQAKRAERAATSHLPDLGTYERLLSAKRSLESSIERWVGLLKAAKRARSVDLDPSALLPDGGGGHGADGGGGGHTP